MVTRNLNHIVITLNIIFLILLGQSVIAQNYTFLGDRSFGTISGETYPYLSSFGNKLVIGGVSVYSGINGDKNDSSCSYLPNSEDFWILMIDENLNILWDKSLGGNEREQVCGIDYVNANLIAVSGVTYSDTSCDVSELTRGARDYWLCLLDSNGNKLLDKRFGSSGIDELSKVHVRRNGGYLLTGTSGGGADGDKSTPNFGGTDYWLICTDSLGNKIWDQSYGGNDLEISSYLERVAFLECKDGSLLIGGRSLSTVGGTMTSIGFGGGADAWLTKTDSLGIPIWDKKYGGDGDDGMTCIVEVDDGYLLFGSSTSKSGGTIVDSGYADLDVWITKTDTAGVRLWDKRYGSLAREFCSFAAPAPDGGYWILARVDGDAAFDISDSTFGSSDYWILKVDSFGNKLWDKRFGGPGTDMPVNFVILPDSSIIISGHGFYGISPIKSDIGHGAQDYWVVHFNYYNNTTGHQDQTSNSSLTVWPIPSGDEVMIQGLPMGIYNLDLVAIDGRMLNRSKVQGGGRISYSLKGYSTGMYILRFTGGNYAGAVKVMKQ